MSLSTNNQLSLGGRAPKSRGTVMVNKPPYAYFVAGSNNDDVNGIYAMVDAAHRDVFIEDAVGHVAQQ
jgi:hypothetical protein